MIPLPDPEGLAAELEQLLTVRSRIDRRLRDLTGEPTTAAAGAAVVAWRSDGKRRRKRRQEADRRARRDREQERADLDDRNPSESIRTVSGGLPTMGKGHR